MVSTRICQYVILFYPPSSDCPTGNLRFTLAAVTVSSFNHISSGYTKRTNFCSSFLHIVFPSQNSCRESRWTSKKYIQNTYFNSRFGRSDFVSIDRTIPPLYNGVLRYLLKYITKTDERITYSRGLPAYLEADISERDVICEIGLWAQKLLLFDNATLYDEGEILGTLDDEDTSYGQSDY